MTDPDRFARYRLIRDEITHEDNLVGARLSWFTSAQAFLLTALAIAQGGAKHLPTMSSNYFFPLLPFVAIASDVLILIGVLSGLQILNRWRAMLDDYPEYPRVQRDGLSVRLGWMAPIGLPVVFLGAWLYLLGAGMMN